jgi:hypothetical protein
MVRHNDQRGIGVVRRMEKERKKGGRTEIKNQKGALKTSLSEFETIMRGVCCCLGRSLPVI